MRKLINKVKLSHWYKTFIEECPVCGRGSVYKERVYGKKSKALNKLYEYKTRYDWCDV